MARKSKRFEKNVVNEATVIYNAALYLRKSKEDGESIETQKMGGISFVQHTPEICIYDIYCENGESGATLERNEFQRMMNDIYNGKVNCIIVKDFSRLIRNHIEGDRIILDVLPMFGVRIISINDNYDSKTCYQGDYLNVSIRNYFNSMYVRDLSKKITSVIRMKQLMGEFIGDVASYGYLKSPADKHKLIIDTQVTGIVKRIFDMIDKERLPYDTIAKILTKEGIDTPRVYFYKMGWVKTCNPNGYWRGETIKRIVTNVVYLGHTKQGMTRSNFLKGYSGCSTTNDCILVENTHEPTIDKALFDRVQQIVEERRNAYHATHSSKSKSNMFAGIIFCGHCGFAMKLNRSSGRIYCNTYLHNKEMCAESASVPEEVLKNIVFSAVKSQVKATLDIKKMMQILLNKPEVIETQRKLVSKIQMQTKFLTNLKFEKSQLFIAYSQGEFTEKYFKEKASKIENKSIEAEKQIEKARKEIERINTLTSEKQWMKEIMNFSSKRIVSREMLHCLIERITIYSAEKIEIKWKFQNELAEFKEMITFGGV